MKGKGNNRVAGVKGMRIFIAFVVLSFSVSAADQRDLVTKERVLQKSGAYLHLPIRNRDERFFGKPELESRRLKVIADGELLHNVAASLADTEDEIDWWAFLYIGDMQSGQDVVIRQALPEDSRALELVRISELPPNDGHIYDEEWRPQFHFSAYRGWNNDSNGMIYYNGKYHLFYQSNPVSLVWDNMYWGHAVSDDMIHWKQLPEALRPNGGLFTEGSTHPSMANGHCHSGSAAVDEMNLLGLQENENKTLLAYFTDTGKHGTWQPFEALSYSTDGGNSWTYWDHNPVIKHKGRDPKVFYHAASGHWIIAAYDEEEGDKDSADHGVAFYRSKDLKNWERTCLVKGFYECPEVFSLPLDGDEENMKWVIYDGKSKYQVGDFDGKNFRVIEPGRFLRVLHGAGTGQCFSNHPEGRRVYIGCYWQKMPGSRFQNSLTVPLEFSLRTTSQGIRLFAEPIQEIESLRDGLVFSAENRAGDEDKGLTLDTPLDSTTADIEISVASGETGPRFLRMDFSGGSVVVDFDQNTLNGRPLDVEWVDVKSIRILIDRPYVEVALNGGEAFYKLSRKHPGRLKNVRLTLMGGLLANYEIYRMKSIWETARRDFETKVSIK
jgi:fructan beta-fructosidase